MYPFSYEGQRIVQEQMVQEALARERIRVELSSKRAGHGWMWHMVRLLGSSLLLKNQRQPECMGWKQSSCNTAGLAAVANKSNRTKFG